MTSTTVRQLGVALVTTSAGALPVFLTSALILQVSVELEFPVEQLGAAVAIYFAAGALTSAPMGRLSERLGPAQALRFGGALSAVCLLLIAVSWDFVTLAACLLLGGVCNALCQPAANLYVTRSIDRSRRGLALALKQSAIPAATLIGGLAVPLISLTVGWRWAFVGCAVMAAVTASVVPAVSDTAKATTPEKGDRAPLGAMLLLASTVGFGAAGAGCLASFAVAGAARVGLVESSAGWLVAFGSALAVATRLALGYRADMRDGGHLKIVAGMLAVGGCAAVGLSTSSPAAFGLAVPIVFSFGWGWPGLFNLSVVSHNSAAPGAATGFTQTGTYLGAAVGPGIFGLLATNSWTQAWSIVPVFFLLAACAGIGARRALQQHRNS